MGTLSTREPYLLAWGMFNDFGPVGPSGNTAQAICWLPTLNMKHTYLPTQTVKSHKEYTDRGNKITTNIPGQNDVIQSRAFLACPSFSHDNPPFLG